MSLRQRPPGTGRLVLVPGDAGGGEFSFDDAMVDRCIDLFLRLHGEFEVVLVDLSAGRSYAAEIVIAATSAPEMARRTSPVAGVSPLDPAAHRGRRRAGLRRARPAGHRRGYGRDREQFLEDIRFIRTAIVDPEHPGPGWPATAAAGLAARGQQGFADGWRPSLSVGRSTMLGAGAARPGPAVARATDHRRRCLGAGTSPTRPPSGIRCDRQGHGRYRRRGISCDRRSGPSSWRAAPSPDGVASALARLGRDRPSVHGRLRARCETAIRDMFAAVAPWVLAGAESRRRSAATSRRSG